MPKWKPKAPAMPRKRVNRGTLNKQLDEKLATHRPGKPPSLTNLELCVLIQRFLSLAGPEESLRFDKEGTGKYNKWRAILQSVASHAIRNTERSSFKPMPGQTSFLDDLDVPEEGREDYH